MSYVCHTTESYLSSSYLYPSLVSSIGAHDSGSDVIRVSYTRVKSLFVLPVSQFDAVYRSTWQRFWCHTSVIQQSHISLSYLYPSLMPSIGARDSGYDVIRLSYNRVISPFVLPVSQFDAVYRSTWQRFWAFTSTVLRNVVDKPPGVRDTTDFHPGGVLRHLISDSVQVHQNPRATGAKRDKAPYTICSCSNIEKLGWCYWLRNLRRFYVISAILYCLCHWWFTSPSTIWRSFPFSAKHGHGTGSLCRALGFGLTTYN